MHETRNNGTNHLYYYYDANGSISSISYNGVRYAFRKNLQGDVIAILDTSGNVVARYTYDAWGKVLSVTDANGNAITSATHVANANPIRYRGYYYDTDTGWYCLNSRYYDPEVKRFINADRIIGANGTFMGYGAWEEENFMIAELSAWRFLIKILSGGLIITILGLFTGCVNHDQKVMGIPIIESNVNIFDVLECEYSPDEIQNIMNMRVTLPELNEKHPVKCLKMHNGAYYAYYRSDENLLILL